jgi:DnaJ-class molecular chaperone
MHNYYEILGVDRDADMREVKRAWREAARTLHPDLPANRGNAHAKRRFVLVKEAYEVLSDPVRRQEYEDRGSSPFLSPGSPFIDSHESARSTRHRSAEDIRLQTETGEGVASIFADLFGGPHQAPPPKKDSPWNPGRLNRDGHASRPKDQAPPPRKGASAWDPGRMEADANADRKSRWGFDPEAMAEAALKGDMAAADQAGGGAPRVQQTRTNRRATPRPVAGNPNWTPPPSRPPPSSSAPSEPRRAGDELKITAQVPFRAAALGGKHTIEYRLVDASGQFQLTRADLFLPAATDDGAEIVLRGKGPPGEGGAAAGDLRVTVTIEDDPIFTRRGRDVIVDLPLTPYEAATGCQVQAPTLQGRQKVTVPPGVRSGQKLRLRGLGIPSEGGGLGGNQEMVIQIHLPEALGSEGLELLKQLDGLSDWNPRGRWPDE